MPKDIWTFDGVSEWGEASWMSSQQVTQAKDKQMKPFLAWLPYIVIGALLVVTRVGFFHLKPILTSEPFVIHIDHILGFENISWDFKFLWNPGIFPFILIAIFTVFLHKMTKEEMKTACRDSVKQVSGAAIALLFGVAMANLYRFTCCPSIGNLVASSDIDRSARFLYVWFLHSIEYSVFFSAI